MSKIADALRKIQEHRVDVHPVIVPDPRLGILGLNEVDYPEDSTSTNMNVGARVVRINKTALRAAGLLGSEGDEKKLADEYRQIKRPIIANALQRTHGRVDNGDLVLVASALSGDGKTFTCINLALSVAQEKDISAILIDADVAKPQISALFDLETEPGLLDYLEDSTVRMQDIIVKTDVPGLWLIPAGRPRANATELLASARMRKLIAELRNGNPDCLVFFDSPPLLQTTESRTLADHVGQVVLVVRAGVTPQDAVLEAIGSLNTGLPVNIILNDSRFGGGGNYYGSYHGYGVASGKSGTEGN